jgi:hypothetical protein
MPILLPVNDQVGLATNAMANLIADLPFQDVLTNGKIEMVLKSFLGAGWKLGAANARQFLMDKHFNGQHLDLAAFQNNNLVFWLETKCSFLQHRADVVRSAETAIEQILGHIQILQDPNFDNHLDFANADKYIVHFLLTVPDRVHVPVWAWPAFPNDLMFHPGELECRYEQHLAGHYESSVYLQVSSAPAVFAVLIKLGGV